MRRPVDLLKLPDCNVCNGLCDAAGKATGFQFGTRGPEDAHGRLEFFDQQVDFAKAQAGDHTQSKPVKFFFAGEGDWDRHRCWIVSGRNAGRFSGGFFLRNRTNLEELLFYRAQPICESAVGAVAELFSWSA